MKLGKVVGFLPTTDATQSRAFFEGQLGLRFVSEDDYALAMESNGTAIRIAKVQQFQPAPYTVLGWEVQKIEAVVTELIARSVSFEQYPFIQNKELGIWAAPDGTKVAWFKDPLGNLLSVHEHS